MRFELIYSILLIVFVTLITFGQGGASNASCKVGSISFTCPESSKILNNGKDGSAFIAVRSGIGLFAMQMKESSTVHDALPVALDSSLRKLYSAGYSDYKAKDSDDFWGNDKYSKYEESKAGIVLFNPKLRQILHIHYLVLDFNGNRIITGFTDVWAKGTEAEASFNEWRGGGGAGDEELQDLILLMTGEKRPELTPGGPPPAMAPKKP
jgi:hypothetical protein